MSPSITQRSLSGLSAVKSQEASRIGANVAVGNEGKERKFESDDGILSDDEELPPENPCQDIRLSRENLKMFLKKELKFSGSFSFNKTYDSAVNPGIRIAGLGVVGLPLSERDAKLVAAHSMQAPFWKGKRAVIDPKVRDAWEIDASKVTLANPSWGDFISTTAAEVCNTLGVNVAASKPKCQLYKLLLYETGSYFLPNVETGEANGMFATLIVVLPSEFTGGTAHLSHCGVSRVHDASSTSSFQTTVLAWYAGVTYEIKPVKSGYQLALAYNLIHTNTSSPRPALPKADLHISKLRHILASWKHSLNPSPQKILYLLDHTYSQYALNGSALKGCDAQNVALLEIVAAKLGFQLGLASLEWHVTGEANDGCGYSRRRRRGGYYGYYPDSESEHMDEDDEDVDFGEVYSREMKITNLVNLDGRALREKVQSSKNSIGAECIPAELRSIVEDGPVDDQEYERGCMGGGSLERWYRRTVFVIWPNFHDAEVGAGHTQNPLDIIRLTRSRTGTRSERRIAQQLLSKAQADKSKASHGKVAVSICTAACKWTDINLWRKVIELCGLQTILGSLSADIFVQALNAFGFTELKPTLEGALTSHPSNAMRIQIIDGLRDKFTAAENRQGGSEFSAWLQTQKQAVIASLKPPAPGEQHLLLNLAKQHGGISFIEDVLLPQLLAKADSDFLVTFAMALHSRKQDLATAGDGDELQIAKLDRLVSISLASSIIKADFYAEVKRQSDIASRTAEARVAAAGELSAQRAHICIVACQTTNNHQLLNALVVKLVDVTRLQPHVTSACMQFAVFKLLDLLKQSGNNGSHNPALHSVFIQLRQKSIFLHLSAMSAWPTEREIEILVDFLVAEVDPTLSLQRVLAKMESLPWQSDRCRQFVTVLQRRSAESNAKAAISFSITKLVQLVVAKVDMTIGNASVYSYGRPTPSFPKVVTELMQFCLDTENMPCSLDLLKRGLKTFNSAQHIQSHLTPLIPELRHWAVSQKLPVSSDPIASTVRCILTLFLNKILGPKPPGAEPMLAPVYKLPCTCAPCISAKNFLTKSKEGCLYLDRIGAPKRRHVEQSLAVYCKTACEWSTISGSPQGLMITKLPAVLKPTQWNADREKAVAVLKSISTNVKELQDIFGGETLIKLARLLGWPVVPTRNLSIPAPSTVVPQAVVPRQEAPTPAVTAPMKRKASDITSAIDLCNP